MDTDVRGAGAERRGGRTEDVQAVVLDPTERVRFSRDVLGPFARVIPFGYWFIRTVDGVDLGDPVAAAHGRPLFDLRADA